MQMIPGLAMAGQQNANQEGGQSGFGTLQSFKNVADPADLFGGSSSKSVFGNIIDPGNVWGMNPDMAGPKSSSGTPSVLPMLPGVGAPQLYDPNSFGGYAKLGAGPYNAMAAQMAGRVYDPRLLAGPVNGMRGMPSAGKGGAMPAIQDGIFSTLQPSMTLSKRMK